ncbi:acyl-CoA dehydrogenase, N-terminal domain protein, partial [Vibrio parahaemolyticus V-223/04]
VSFLHWQTQRLCLVLQRVVLVLRYR